MRSYTLHMPAESRPGDAHGLDRAILVPDGFVWPAFAFSVFWFLYHRLWVAALIVLAGLAALASAGYALGLPTVAGAAVSLLAAWLIGLEASSLRRWTLARRGRPARDAVVAANAEEAEARAITRWLAGAAAVPDPRPPAFPSGPTRGMEPVVGLFPAREGGR
ncbi:DUF2628 domain-containing protein [Methylobacterium sp. NEAU 140]|uniref:DUF2628 domain-containing protein n=1 Tax=Methylobacterium sp. NEAU 140 TaxID=3064945 RepID=UPI0027356F87|nr:DUF2628 domain-containing protein [Methylobacterium sp. NEAU 140]MDP4022212.1 DUF2628 domain-containing protein [Methylobacterium sp. NEAU 140]